MAGGAWKSSRRGYRGGADAVAERGHRGASGGSLAHRRGTRRRPGAAAGGGGGARGDSGGARERRLHRPGGGDAEGRHPRPRLGFPRGDPVHAKARRSRPAPCSTASRTRTTARRWPRSRARSRPPRPSGGSPQIERDRKAELVRRQAVAQSELDVAEAQLGRAEGELARLNGTLARQKLELSYTEITAPFAGIVGLSAADVGALVGPDTGPLTTLTRLDPINVTFPVATALLLDYQGAVQRGEASREATVRLTLPNGQPIRSPATSTCQRRRGAGHRHGHAARGLRQPGRHAARRRAGRRVRSRSASPSGC